MFDFGRKRSRQRALALMDPFRDEFAKAFARRAGNGHGGGREREDG